MRNITRDEAIEMYAQFLTAHHGPGAERVARIKAKVLDACGDADGVLIWTQLAELIVSRRKHMEATRH